MSVPSIEKLTALQPWTVVGVSAGDLLELLADAADAVASARAELAQACEVLADYRRSDSWLGLVLVTRRGCIRA
jgi:hypothetical protein